jgi:hypothetical protein
MGMHGAASGLACRSNPSAMPASPRINPGVSDGSTVARPQITPSTDMEWTISASRRS